MKLKDIQRNHIIDAANIIGAEGLPKDQVWSQYYVDVEGREYPFKHLVKTAYKFVSKDELTFQSNDTYRHFIENTLDFKISYYKDGYNFFTKDELDFYSSIVNTEYRKVNQHQIFYGQKLNSIIAKTKYWAEQLLIDGYKLRKDGNWLTAHTARISPYFWPRIFKNEDKDIFFNVEVNGEDRFIGYKLDGYFETTKALPKHKLDVLKDYKDKINWEWPKIEFDKIATYDWNRLIKESREYVEKYSIHHDNLKALLSKNQKFLD